MALTDVEMVIIQKQDLYEIDLQFKKEIFDLFKDSNQLLQKLLSSQGLA